MFKAFAVVALGAVGMLRPAPAEASPVPGDFCVHCVDSSGCGLEEALCQAWGCGTVGQAVCGAFGNCTPANGKNLITCNGGADE